MADEEITGGIVLKDRDGNDVVYEWESGIPAIMLNTSDGGTQTFIKGELAEATVALDFSEGDMEVTPEDGAVLSKVNIPMPETLIPENIAEGVDIAGVIGTLVGGGSSGYCGNCGTITGTGAVYVLEHGLGVVPDVVMIYKANYSYTNSILRRGFQCSEKAATMLGTTKYGLYSRTVANSENSSHCTKPLEYETANDDAPMYGATDKIVNIGQKFFFLENGGKYHWLAIGSLT